jgi:hypothetical protein
MIANNKLVKALRDAAARLEDESVFYSWYYCESCNCGVLAQSALGVNTLGLVDLILGTSNGYWSDKASYAYCGTTGLPLPEVFRRLSECGLEKWDYDNIEQLKSPEVLAITGPLEKDNPAHVAKYFLAQADLLEAELKPASSNSLQLAPIHSNSECQHYWASWGCLYCSATKPIEVKELV